MPDTPFLAWIPLATTAWSAYTEGLTFEEKGLLIDVIVRAWNQTTPPCTIADSPVAMGQLLGDARQRLEPTLRRFFLPDPAHPGRLRNAWLSSLHEAQLAKYQKKVEAGVLSGAARRQRKPRNADAALAPRKGNEHRSSVVQTNSDEHLNTVRTEHEHRSEQPPLVDTIELHATASDTPPNSRGANYIEHRSNTPRTIEKSPSGSLSSGEREPERAARDHADVPRSESPAAAPSARRPPRLPGRPTLMRDSVITTDGARDPELTTAQLEDWLRSRPDAESTFAEMWQGLADQDPDSEPGFLRVPALRRTWRRLRDDALPAQPSTNGATP